MITDQDIKKLKEAFLTKEDTSRFLTKDDAAKFLTKDDATKFLTKDDIPKIARVTIEMAKEVFTTKDEFNELRDDFREFKSSMDVVVKLAVKHDIEIKAINHRLKKMQNPA